MICGDFIFSCAKGSRQKLLSGFFSAKGVPHNHIIHVTDRQPYKIWQEKKVKMEKNDLCLILSSCKNCVSKISWTKGRPPRKKVAVILDFVQMRSGEGPAQIFCLLFTNCTYWVNLGIGREGETPAQFFWHIGVQKKRCKLSKLGGRGGRGNLDKIQKNSYFFQTTTTLLF